ncbi:hypothetical protein P3339_04415 [Microbulbifer sp. MLAF003]|uniref:hypothetical protein n=1 Tax=Microbulbifer TaxID=48073 RepID=UPI0003655C4A|nr:MULTISPECIES: hypothetical protein [Microbulbifer]WHI52065.1 hypothetical protein P3339_04415 [Microbulbifer sp. MLAF003]
MNIRSNFKFILLAAGLVCASQSKAAGVGVDRVYLVSPSGTYMKTNDEGIGLPEVVDTKTEADRYDLNLHFKGFGNNNQNCLEDKDIIKVKQYLADQILFVVDEKEPLIDTAEFYDELPKTSGEISDLFYIVSDTSGCIGVNSTVKLSAVPLSGDYYIYFPDVNPSARWTWVDQSESGTEITLIR